MSITHPRPAPQRGITLIEPMFGLVVIAILAVVAFQAYQRYTTAYKRAQVKVALVHAASLQKMHFLHRKRYASDMRDLGFPTNPALLGRIGQYLPALSTSGFIYQISLVNVTATAYTLIATPLASDPQCNIFTLTSTGKKGVSAATQPASFCW